MGETVNRAGIETWMPLRPPLSARASASAFQRCASSITRIQRREADDDRNRALAAIREKALAAVTASTVKDRALLDAAMRVLLDLAQQRWRVRLRAGSVEVCRPLQIRTDPDAEKMRV